MRKMLIAIFVLLLAFGLFPSELAAQAQTKAAEEGVASQTTIQGTGGPDHGDVKPKSVKAWIAKQPRKKKGALFGALAGAVAGALITGNTRGVLAGAAAGALGGYLIGRRKDKLFASRDEAVERLAYEPTQGYVFRIDEVRCEPAALQPGESAVLYVRYIVIAPDPKEKLQVQAYTGLQYDGEFLTGSGPDTFKVKRGGGIVETQTVVTIPKEAPEGSYTIRAEFEDAGGNFEEARQASVYVALNEDAEAGA